MRQGQGTGRVQLLKLRDVIDDGVELACNVSSSTGLSLNRAKSATFATSAFDSDIGKCPLLPLV